VGAQGLQLVGTHWGGQLQQAAALRKRGAEGQVHDTGTAANFNSEEEEQ